MTVIQTTQLLHAIGYYTLPVTCLIEPDKARLLRPVDELFVKSLKEAMKANPSTDVAPIIGLMVLKNGINYESNVHPFHKLT